MSSQTPSVVNVKPGYLTTEFLGKSVIQFIALLVLFGIIPEADQAHASAIAAAAITAVEVVYAYSRGLVKAAAHTAAAHTAAGPDAAAE